MEGSGVSSKEKESHLMGKLSKLAFVGYDFQHFSFFFLTVFVFPNVSKERHWRGIVIKGHVKVIFLPIIALSFPQFCHKLEQTLHKHQGQHS